MINLIKTNREKVSLSLILILALIIRIGVVVLKGDIGIPYEFGTLVPNLLAGRGYSYYALDQENTITSKFLSDPRTVFPSAFMPPVYPFFLAGMSLIIGQGTAPVLMIELIQSLMGVVVCYLVFLTTKRLFDLPSANIALIVTSFYPILVFSSSQISAVTIYGLLAQITILMLLRFSEKETSKTRFAILSGLSLGLLILARAETLLFSL